MTDRTCRRATALLVTASTLALASPAGAVDVLFSTDRDAEAHVGQRVNQNGGLTQIRLDSGATASFVEDADYRINADGTIDLYAGSVTVAGGPQGATVVRMPDGVEGRVSGKGSAASFSVAEDGSSRGHAMSGNVQIVRGGMSRIYTGGEMWQASGQGFRRVVSNGEQSAPEAGEGGVVAMAEGGPVAPAENGIPVLLGDALAAAGASGDVISAARRVEAAAGNPSLDTFPSGDLALLVSYAAQFEHLNGGTPFPNAGADIIRTYLGFLAGGGARADFLTAYAGFLTQYLDLIRAGALPSSFSAASLSDINAFIAYTGRSSGFGSLSNANRTLVEAYLAFLQGGGNPDLFARRYTDLVDAYFAFVRGGGDPAAFTGATQATLDAYIAFLNDSGLVAQLTDTNRALLLAYLAKGGFAFTGQYQAALDAYFAYLASGKLPSSYASIDPATLRQYLETLQATGLFDQVLGAQADFYRGYLAYLQGGGALDGYSGLNANVFAGYATQLADFYAYIQAGGLPNGYSGDVSQLFAYLTALEEAGALDDFLGQSSDFFGDYLDFVQDGGDANLFAQLPGLNLETFADALNAYATYLAGGGLPSGYSTEDLAKLADYLEILQNSGQLDSLLGSNAALINAYFAYLASGGAPDAYSGLPVYASYVDALNAYYAYLAGGGLPGDYVALTQAQIKAYLDALAGAGGLTAYSGLQAFFADYYAYLAGGGNENGYASLPVYQGYLAALQAYYDYLLAGGLPSDYTALTQVQIEAYLALLSQYGVLQASLSGSYLEFLVDYLAYLGTGGNPDDFAGLPSSGGGTGGGGTGTPGTPGAPTPMTGYSGGFNAATANVNMIVAGGLRGGAFAGGESGFQTSSYTLNGAGGLTSYDRGGSTTRTNGSATIDDIYGNADVLIGRWHSGTNTGGNPFTMNANQGLHYMLARPLEVALPASGRIDYYLVAATPATIADGSYAPGVFDAAMAILFGSQNRLAMEGTVTMPTGAADYVYSFSTVGGMADAEMTTNNITVNANGAFNTYIENATDNAGRCTAAGSCGFGVFGSFAKDEDTVGMTWEAYSGEAGKAIVGAAIFESGPARSSTSAPTPTPTPAPTPTPTPAPTPTPTPAPTPTPTPTPTGFDLTNANISFARSYSRFGLTDTDLVVTRGLQGGTVENENELVDFATSTGLYDSNTASVTDANGTDRFLIGRWSDGTYTYPEPPNSFAASENQGLHYLVAAPLSTDFALPTSGTVTYDLLHATKPTIAGGSYAPGTFDAQFGIRFDAATYYAGIEGTIVMPSIAGGDSLVWTFQTSGGFTNDAGWVEREFPRSNRFSFAADANDNQGHCISACEINFDVVFAGANVNEVGMIYNIGNGEVGTANEISGTAIWGPAGTAPITSNPYLGTTTTPVPAADVNMASAQSAWTRWTGNATQTAISTMAQPELQQARAAALAGIDIDAIEARLGKLVTFDRR